MNQDEYSDIDTEPERAELCLESRKVRLFIAQHPGSTQLEIKEGTGVEPQHPLFFMVKHGLVKFTNQKEDGHRKIRWYVVPQ